jgi:hypothetical protein
MIGVGGTGYVFGGLKVLAMSGLLGMGFLIETGAILLQSMFPITGWTNALTWVLAFLGMLSLAGGMFFLLLFLAGCC